MQTQITWHLHLSVVYVEGHMHLVEWKLDQPLGYMRAQRSIAVPKPVQIAWFYT